MNPAGKLTSIVAGMAAGADSIDDLNVIRSGGLPRLFGEVCAPATLGQFLREFTHGHGLQLASVARAHLVNLVRRSGLLLGIETRAYVDIDSLLHPVFGHAKRGASFGHTKIAGKQVLRRGLSPLATTISTRQGAPVVAGIRLRAGKAGSGKGAASMVREAITLARAAGATGEVLVRGDSDYGNSAVVAACREAGARFSLVLLKNRSVQRTIAAIGEDAWTPVRYPGAVVDPDTGELISDAEVAEVEFTAFASTKHPVTARSGATTRSSPTTPSRSSRRTSPTAATSSRCQPGWPGRSAAACCTCPRTGLGPHRGTPSGTRSSPPGHQQLRPDLDHRPRGHDRRQTWKGWADQRISRVLQRRTRNEDQQSEAKIKRGVRPRIGA